MGRISSFTGLRAALIAAFVMLAGDHPATAGSMTFLALRDVSVRHDGGSLLRGGIRSITHEEVVVMTSRGEKSVALSNVTSIIAADGSFKYFPNQESFDEFLTRSAGMRGVTIVLDDAPGGAGGSADTGVIGSVSRGYAKAIGMQPSTTPPAPSSSGGFVQSDGFAGASQRPQELARLEAPEIPELAPAIVQQIEKQRMEAQLAAKSPSFGVPGANTPTGPSGSELKFGAPVVEILICSNPTCRKEVPGAKYGEKCPHCGTIWLQQSSADIAAATPPANGSSTPVADPKNPFSSGPAPAPAPVAVQQGQPPGAVAPVAGQAQGFSLETIPWWGKILGFGASIMVLMWVLGRR